MPSTTMRRTPLFPLAAALAAGAAQAEKVTPIITTDVVYGTAELVYDIYAEAWGRISEATAPHTSQLLSHLPKDPLGELCSKVGVKKKVVMQRWSATRGSIMHAKAVAADQAAQAYQPLNAGAIKLVSLFERVMPKYTGLIPKTLGDVLVFLVYFAAVFYVLFRILVLALRLVMGLVCFFCCCRCCRCCCRKAKAGKAGKKGGSAAEKGKVAVQAAAATKAGKKAAKKA